MDGTGERDLIRMKIFPAGFAKDLCRAVTEDILDRLGNILNTRIQGQIWTELEESAGKGVISPCTDMNVVSIVEALLVA